MLIRKAPAALCDPAEKSTGRYALHHGRYVNGSWSGRVTSHPKTPFAKLDSRTGSPAKNCLLSRSDETTLSIGLIRSAISAGQRQATEQLA